MPRIYVQADNLFASLRLRQIRVIRRITTSAQIIETAVYRNAATAAGHEVVAVSALDHIPTVIAAGSITDDLVVWRSLPVPGGCDPGINLIFRSESGFLRFPLHNLLEILHRLIYPVAICGPGYNFSLTLVFIADVLEVSADDLLKDVLEYPGTYTHCTEKSLSPASKKMLPLILQFLEDLFSEYEI